MTQYWRIRANPEEFENMNLNQKVQKCLREKKIIVGFPASIKSFKENVEIGDIFITRDDDKYYIGKITSSWKAVEGEDLFYREVEWLDAVGESIESPSPLFPQGSIPTCAGLNPKAEAIVRERLKNT